MNSIYTMEFTFFFKPLVNDSDKPDAVAWIKTHGVSDSPFSWNADIQVYSIDSTAEDTSVDTYLTKSEMRAMSSAVAGDYYATGNTLMTDANNDSVNIRESWLNYDHSSSAAVVASTDGHGIPEGSTNPDGTVNEVNVTAAYLYWTAWKDYSSISNVFSEDANDLNEWDISTSGTESRIPASDGDIGGTWTVSGAPSDWISPTSNAADTGGSGDGFESNPTYAYAADNMRARNANRNTPGDRHRYSGYDVDVRAGGESNSGDRSAFGLVSEQQQRGKQHECGPFLGWRDYLDRR